MTAPVLFEVANGWGVATSTARRAERLTLEMIRLLRPQLALGRLIRRLRR